MKTIILGAGVTGLAAGYNKDYPIFEASNTVGGICRSYKKDGFDFSIGGGHWIFENDKTKNAIEFIKSLVDLNYYERIAGIYYNKIFPYPIQTFSQKSNEAKPGYFKHWLLERFGQEMGNMFFLPFNEKYTAGLYDDIVQFDAFKTPPAGSVGFVSKFYDPVGGLNKLIDSMASKCNISYLQKAVNINTVEKIVNFESGEWAKYDRLISTMPLNKLLELCGINNFALPYSSVFVLNIGAKPGINMPKEHWMYIPFCDSGFYRVGFYSNVDKSKAPDWHVSLSVEMAYHPEDKEFSLKQKINEIIEELQKWGWIENVITVDPTFVKCAYTWNKTLEEREMYLEWLKNRDIISTGRYGLWKFQGMAESIQQGLEL